MQPQSNSRPACVLPGGRKLAPKAKEFLDRLGTWALTLALAVGGLIVALWLIELW